MLGLTQQLLSILMLSLAASTVSMTATKAKISKPLRGWIAKKSTWFGELTSCPYCFGHWVSFAAVAAVRPTVTQSGVFLVDLLVSALAVTALSAMFCSLIFKSIASLG